MNQVIKELINSNNKEDRILGALILVNKQQDELTQEDFNELRSISMCETYVYIAHDVYSTIRRELPYDVFCNYIHNRYL